MYIRSTGVVCLIMLAGGCATAQKADAPHTQQGDIAGIEQRLADEQLKELERGLVTISDGRQDEITARERAFLLMRIGAITHDLKYTNEAIDILSEQLSSYPTRTDIMVYLGACYTLSARDHTGILYTITPLGWRRIWNINRGISLMNKAVTMDPLNPIVRMVRAMPSINMPSVFGQYESGMADLELIISWMSDTDVSPDIASITSSPMFSSEVHYHLARGYMMAKKYGRAVAHLKEVIRIAPATPTGRAADEYVEILEAENGK